MTAVVPTERRAADSHHAQGTLRVVVLGLVAIAILTVLSVATLAFSRRPAPDALIGVGSAAVGALATMVARAGRTGIE